MTATKTSAELKAKLTTAKDGTVSSNGVPVGKATRTTGGTDKTPAERRLAVVKAMRKAGATNERVAVTATELAKKTGMTRFDVYGQLYHTHKLQVEGFAKQVKHEDARELAYYLTAKGAKAIDEQLA